jgi:diketogulonate reductase-like aldo/keto reductase
MSLTLESKAKLNNDVEIPYLGLGVYQSSPGKTTERAVRYALKAGYRHIDTAELYGNEADIGRVLRECEINREDVFITTKVWNSHQGFDSTLHACEGSLRRLGLSYIDLYLIHWPVQGLGNDTWRAMIKLYHEGKARAIGVSNYSIKEMNEILESADVVPAVNQVEFHPFLFNEKLLSSCKYNKIQLEAYSPLTRGKRLYHQDIVRVARKYGKTPAQVLIRWSLQQEIVVIPKSIHEDRIRENSQVFDFNLEPEDMKFMSSLNENFRTVFLD